MNTIMQDTENREKFQKFFHEISVPAKYTLLNEGEIASKLYAIKKGCLRMWFNKDGRDITFQFFFENTAVSSIESFMQRVPSLFSIESIEASELVYIKAEDFQTLMQHYPQIKDGMFELLLNRMGNYAKLFLSRIKDNPEQRYKELLEQHPEIVLRVPQHYIASYLGITPISLSRIRNRK